MLYLLNYTISWSDIPPGLPSHPDIIDEYLLFMLLPMPTFLPWVCFDIYAARLAKAWLAPVEILMTFALVVLFRKGSKVVEAELDWPGCSLFRWWGFEEELRRFDGNLDWCWEVLLFDLISPWLFISTRMIVAFAILGGFYLPTPRLFLFPS